MKYSRKRKIVASNRQTNLHYLKKVLYIFLYTSIIVLFITCIALLTLYLFGFKGEHLTEWFDTPIGDFVASFLFYLSLGIIAFTLGKARFSLGKIKHEQISVLTLLCVLIALAEISPDICISNIILQFVNQTAENDPLPSINVGTFFIMCILGPFAEELFFRGVVTKLLLKLRTSHWVGIILSAILFALVHGNLAQMPGAFIGGIVYGWIYYSTRSIYPTFIMHVINNTVVFIGLALDSNTNSSADIPLWFYVWAVLSLILYICFIVKLSYKLKGFCRVQ